MAIFEAEHRHKTAPEDQLTSRIFGALAIMDKHNVLFEFLLKLADGQDNQLRNLRNSLISLVDKDNLNIELWAYFGERYHGEGYPDVYIEGIPNYLMVIEVKENTKATSDQIINQFRSARKECRENQKEIAYFLLTKDEESPQDVIREAENRLKRYDARIFWIQWTQVWKWLTEIRDEKTQLLKGANEGLLTDLIQLLGDKGMKDATEIKCEWFTGEVAESVDKLNRLYGEICLMVLKLHKELDSLELKESGEDKLEFYSPEGNTMTMCQRKPSRDKDKNLVPSSIEMNYKDKRWKAQLLRNADIFVEANISQACFSVGFYNGNISETECTKLEEAAEKKRLHTERDFIGKGKLYVAIRYYLTGNTPDNRETKDVTFDALKSSLRNIRDFVREYYGIEHTPRTNTKSIRRK